MDGIQRVIEQISHVRFPRVEIIKKFREQNNQLPSVSRTFQVKRFRPLHCDANRGFGSLYVIDPIFRNTSEILVREFRVVNPDGGILRSDREGLPLNIRKRRGVTS
jgi:hypothetical protein